VIHGIEWLAGWLEGEGTFHAHTTKRLLKNGVLRVYKNESITGCSTDIDTVRKVADMLGAGNFYQRTVKQNEKPCWSFRICGKEARKWMIALAGHMGSRRKSKIIEVMIECERQRAENLSVPYAGGVKRGAA